MSLVESILNRLRDIVWELNIQRNEHDQAWMDLASKIGMSCASKLMMKQGPIVAQHIFRAFNVSE